MTKQNALHFFFAATFILLFSISSVGVAEDLQALTPEQMKENMVFLKTKMYETHLNPFHNISKGEYDALYEQILSELNKPLSPIQFYFKANRFVAVHKDAHTRMRFDYVSTKLPLKFVWLSDGVAIVKAPLNPELVGSRVLSIDHADIDAWLERFTSNINHENLLYVRWSGERYLVNQWIHAYYSGDPEIKSVEVRTEKNGVIKNTVVNFIEKNERIKLMGEDDSLSKYYSPDYFSYKYFDNISAGYFELAACKPSKEYSAAVDNFMSEVKKRDYRNVIIDIRENGGGETVAMNPLLEYMPVNEVKLGDFTKRFSKNSVYKNKNTKWYKPKSAMNKEPFKGTVYVLISRHTFSSGIEVAVAFQDSKIGLLVGQKTSNAPCSYGATPTYNLPFGKFTVNISTNFWKPASGNCQHDGVIPDIEVPYTLNDVFENRDPVMEWLQANLK